MPDKAGTGPILLWMKPLRRPFWREPLGIAKPRLAQAAEEPPFRFIYDLFNSIRTKTGLSEGLLTDEELAGDFSKKGSKSGWLVCGR